MSTRAHPSVLRDRASEEEPAMLDDPTFDAPADDFSDALRDRVTRSRAEQNLPPTVEDKAALAAVVAAFTGVTKP